MEVYRVGPEQPLIIRHWGKWSPEHGIQVETTSLYKRRSDFNGLTINASYINVSNRSVYIPSVDGYYGSQMADGSFNGLVSMIQHQQVHMTASNLMMMPNRRTAVDYLTSLLEERTYLFIKQPEIIMMQWTDFVRPFSTALWCTDVVMILVLGCCLWLLCKYNWRENYCTIPQAVFVITASFYLQGRSDSCKVLLLTSYVTSTVLLAGYSASLISTLTTKEAKLPFVDFLGLVKKGTHMVGLLPSSAQLDTIKYAADPILRQVYTDFIAPYEDSLPQTDEEGLHRVCTGNYAYMGEFIETMATNLPCRVVHIPEAFIPVTLSIAIHKQSPYRSIFKFYLNEMRRSGILRRFMLQTLNYQSHQDVSQSRSVELIHVVPLFGILLIGIIASLIIFLLEKRIHHKHPIIEESEKSDKYKLNTPKSK
ncbi:hypothetical protein L9F63_012542 [Diploptera punctata]|uniref:Ionotropic glutamate receptor C-terminal domain-containing protein n=1 Tax=Diploptera punctata TaxID=6984 RepID=A0AAD8AC91_DIPPU|nr:hypothetical protein L9F63_012542 [Diploptera punctata]